MQLPIQSYKYELVPSFYKLCTRRIPSLIGWLTATLCLIGIFAAHGTLGAISCIHPAYPSQIPFSNTGRSPTVRSLVLISDCVFFSSSASPVQDISQGSQRLTSCIYRRGHEYPTAVDLRQKCKPQWTLQRSI